MECNGLEMSEELYTVEFAAQRLKLHPTTILRFIRDGRLAAAKVGKSYRILRSELDKLAGAPVRPGSLLGGARVTSIVDVAGVDAERARRLGAMTTAALSARSHTGASMRADVIHDPDASHLKIVLVGPPNDTATLLGLLQIWLDA